MLYLFAALLGLHHQRSYCKKESNNIDVYPNIICHAEQSEASLFKVVLRSNALGDVANARCETKTSFISLAQSQQSH